MPTKLEMQRYRKRRERIVVLRAAGLTLQQIGQRYRIRYQRVHQILDDYKRLQPDVD